MAITPSSTMRRLAFIKYLHSRSESPGEVVDLLAAAALLTLHDAVEMFLLLACEHRNVTLPKRPQFEDYWPPLCNSLGVNQLPEQTAMRRLNTARVALKHHGHIAAASEVDGYLHTVASFFADVTKLIFDIEFAEISMAEFIEPESARLAYEQAERALTANDLVQAAEHIAVAFDLMMAHYTLQLLPDEGRRVFNFGARSGLGHFSLHPNRGKDSIELAREVERELAPINGALRVFALGLDFRKYTRFVALLPSVSRGIQGQPPVVRWFGNIQQSLTPRYLRFCIDYTVESALRLGTFRVED
jgi:hypothetical protein